MCTRRLGTRVRPPNSKMLCVHRRTENSAFRSGFIRFSLAANDRRRARGVLHVFGNVVSTGNLANPVSDFSIEKAFSYRPTRSSAVLDGKNAGYYTMFTAGRGQSGIDGRKNNNAAEIVRQTIYVHSTGSDTSIGFLSIGRTRFIGGLHRCESCVFRSYSPETLSYARPMVNLDGRLEQCFLNCVLWNWFRET